MNKRELNKKILWLVLTITDPTFSGGIFANRKIIPLKYINTLRWTPVVLNTNADNQKQLPDFNKILEYVWHNVNTMLRKRNMRLKLHLNIFGYKTSEKDHIDFNYFLTLLLLTIYKTYYVSEQKKWYYKWI